MLYQTPPLIFPFNHSANQSFASSSLPVIASPPQGYLKVEKMEYAQPFKTSFTPEMDVLDDAWLSGGGAVGGGGCVGDDFFVDDLLDFSNEDVEGLLEEEEEEEEKDESVSSLEEIGPSENLDENSNNSNPNSDSVKNNDLELVSASELAVPADDLADLEWLSHFVEDSFAANSDSLPYVRDGRDKNRSQTEKTIIQNRSRLVFETQVPAKARSKRSRTGGRVWSPLTDSSSTTSSSSSTCLIFSNAFQNPDLFYCLGKPPSKKQKKEKKSPENNQPQRRCSHCLVQKTPQWRAGPLGAKTLCNACGVRYKSGRLLPEYRPASSPTFLSDVHSNNHRKVLEMRRKKEHDQPLESNFPVVQTC